MCRHPTARLKPCPFKAVGGQLAALSLRPFQTTCAILGRSGRENKRCHAEMTFRRSW
jgi:hypothetical protein